MAVKFIEPGGDADFSVATTNGFWASVTGAAVATDFVHGGHQRSIKYRAANADKVQVNSVVQDSGTRISFYVYLNALPTANAVIAYTLVIGTANIGIRLTSGGVMQLVKGSTQIGSNGSTLSTGVWYRICLAYTITSSSVNRFELFLDGVSSISVTNASVTATASDLQIGNILGDTTLDIRMSDYYIDDSSSLADTGDIWVTAKRPSANGTANGFTTQIGSGGSGYGTGHSPQVNERALSTTNGWSMVGAGSAITEEYNIESAATGDIDISGATIVDYCGWISQSALVSETATMITGGINSTYATGTANKVFTKIAGSSTYPAGTGADIGVITSTDLTTFSLYEAGILVAYIPAAPPPPTSTTYGSLLARGIGVA